MLTWLLSLLWCFSYLHSFFFFVFYYVCVGGGGVQRIVSLVDFAPPASLLAVWHFCCLDGMQKTSIYGGNTCRSPILPFQFILDPVGVSGIAAFLSLFFFCSCKSYLHSAIYVVN